MKRRELRQIVLFICGAIEIRHFAVFGWSVERIAVVEHFVGDRATSPEVGLRIVQSTEETRNCGDDFGSPQSGIASQTNIVRGVMNRKLGGISEICDN